MAFGHAYGAYSAFGNMLEKCLVRVEKAGKTMEEVAEQLVRENLDSEALGASDLMLRDPAAKRMFRRAEDLGVAGKYINFTREIVKAAQRVSEEPVDLDMLGATGATMMDLGFSPEAIWAIIAVTRAFAAGAHYIEEVERGEFRRFGQTLTPERDYDGPPDRPVPPLKDRKEISEPAQTHTLDEWKSAIDARRKIFGSGYGIVEEIEDPSKKTGVKKVGK
jgi:citrate synthase